jgi:hypothetical protein
LQCTKNKTSRDALFRFCLLKDKTMHQSSTTASKKIQDLIKPIADSAVSLTSCDLQNGQTKKEGRFLTWGLVKAADCPA